MQVVVRDARTAGSDGPRAKSRWRSISSAALIGVRIGLGAAFGLWVGDLALLASLRGDAAARQWLMGAGAALFVAASTALVTGARIRSTSASESAPKSLSRDASSVTRPSPTSSRCWMPWRISWGTSSLGTGER
jgi:hypothetical protein